jgi:hypothetical protein
VDIVNSSATLGFRTVGALYGAGEAEMLGCAADQQINHQIPSSHRDLRKRRRRSSRVTSARLSPLSKFELLSPKDPSSTMCSTLFWGKHDAVTVCFARVSLQCFVYSPNKPILG